MSATQELALIPHSDIHPVILVRILCCIFRIALAVIGTAGLAAESWPQFRGPNGQGFAPSASPPIHFHLQTNLAWKSDCAPGLSSPVLWGSHLFLTTFQTGKLSVASWDAHRGTPLWSWSIPAGPVQDVHTSSSPAAPTPAVDADRVYAYFGSWGLIALDHDGRESWRHPMPPPKNRYGMATSPILHGPHLILVLDADDLQSRIVAFARDSGKIAWQTDRPGQRATWSTPTIWSPSPAGPQHPDELIVFSALRLTAYDPRDGRERWFLDGFPQETVSVPVIGKDLVYAGAAALGGRGTETYDAMGWKQLEGFDRNGDHRIQIDEVPADFRMVLRPDLPKDHPGYAVPSPFRRSFKGYDLNRDEALDESEWNEGVKRWEASSKPILMAVRPGPQSHGAQDRVAWKTARGLPEMPSLYLDRERNRLYLVRDGGLLTCLDAQDGRSIFQERLGAAGQYSASPIGSPGLLFLSSVNGTITVIDTRADTLRILARNDLTASIHATPALAGDTLYVRTSNQLLAFRSPQVQRN